MGLVHLFFRFHGYSTMASLAVSAVSFPFFQPAMPPRRSTRAKRPSARATQSQPPKRARQTAPNAADVSDTPGPPLADRERPSPTPAGGSIPASLIDQIVTRVADEVTRRLSPPVTPAPVGNLAPSSAGLSAAPFLAPPTSPDAPAALGTSLASSLLPGSAPSTQQLLSGELPVVQPESRPTQVFTSCSLPIDARVSDRLRAKIWKNELVDVASLATNPVLENRFKLSVQSSDNSSAPSLCMEPLARVKPIQTIEAWMSAFHIFVAVYTSKYPREAPSLRKYGEVVQDLAARGHN